MGDRGSCRFAERERLGAVADWYQWCLRNELVVHDEPLLTAALDGLVVFSGLIGLPDTEAAAAAAAAAELDLSWVEACVPALLALSDTEACRPSIRQAAMHLLVQLVAVPSIKAVCLASGGMPVLRRALAPPAGVEARLEREAAAAELARKRRTEEQLDDIAQLARSTGLLRSLLSPSTMFPSAAESPVALKLKAIAKSVGLPPPLAVDAGVAAVALAAKLVGRGRKSRPPALVSPSEAGMAGATRKAGHGSGGWTPGACSAGGWPRVEGAGAVRSQRDGVCFEDARGPRRWRPVGEPLVAEQGAARAAAEDRKWRQAAAVVAVRSLLRLGRLAHEAALGCQVMPPLIALLAAAPPPQDSRSEDDAAKTVEDDPSAVADLHGLAYGALEKRKKKRL